MSQPESNDILDQLIEVLKDRKTHPSEKSYTARLFAGGEKKICQKITEEAGELVEAAFEDDSNAREHFIYETADLVFHTLVLLVQKDVSLDEIRAELSRRFGVSGLEEKANRG